MDENVLYETHRDGSLSLETDQPYSLSPPGVSINPQLVKIRLYLTTLPRTPFSRKLVKLISISKQGPLLDRSNSYAEIS